MTSNLKYTLTANSTAIGINHSTNETFTFSTGSVCGGGNTNAACIMNGNTVMTEQVANGGYYYNWYAATADTGTASMASGDATGSICPVGWRLPANYSNIPNKSYGSITMAYLGFANNKAESHYITLGLAPISWLMSGQYYFGAPRYTGGGAYYWSSTAAPDGYAWNAGFNGSVTHPQEGQLKYMGFPVRCVAQ